MKSPIIIATRGSDLALWQANYVKSLLKKIGVESELRIIKTQGDKIQNLSLDKLEGKGFFTKEIEDALLNEEADIAVHSHKDLPTESPKELVIAAVPAREDPSELLLIRKESVDAKRKFSLKRNPVVGTSSARRKSQMLAFRKDIELKDLRGNVPTRVNKLREGMYDAIIIASAGVERLELDLSDFHIEKIDPHELIPAPAQGALAIQIRKRDKDLFVKLSQINKPEVQTLVGVERKVLNIFQGGCQMPVGVLSEYDDEKEVFKLRVAKSDSWDKLPVSIYLESKQAEGLAEKAVERINNIKPCSVFITRNVREDDYLYNSLTGNGFNVEGKSLIEFIKTPFHYFPDTDWIFFSSKHAVKYFFQQKPVLKDQKFGCIGKSTSEALRKYGKRAEFLGYSTDTKLTGKQFASRVGSGTVLFPQAKGSMKSIQNAFVKGSQVVDLTVYETLKHTEVITDADILVFTSPSNLEAFISKNKISKQQRMVAMGEATGNAIRKMGLTNYVVPDAFDDTALARAVFGISSL